MASSGKALGVCILERMLTKWVQKLKDLNYNPVEDVNPMTKKLEQLFFAHPNAIELRELHPDIILMDCTYKTNRFRMPLLNICAVTGNKKTIQIVLCFLSGEKDVSYEWALSIFEN